MGTSLWSSWQVPVTSSWFLFPKDSSFKLWAVEATAHSELAGTCPVFISVSEDLRGAVSQWPLGSLSSLCASALFLAALSYPLGQDWPAENRFFCSLRPCTLPEDRGSCIAVKEPSNLSCSHWWCKEALGFWNTISKIFIFCAGDQTWGPWHMLSLHLT